MPEEQSTRDRVRALVREVLNNALPEEESGDASQTAATSSPTSAATSSANAPAGAPAPSPAKTTTAAPPTRPAAAPTASATDERPIARDESSKTVITEADVRGLERGARLRIAEGARLTPLAADIVREQGIELVRRVSRRGLRESKSVGVGADHGGYPLKEELKIYLAELGHRVRDFGTNSTDAVDYPDFAHAVARAVSDGECDLGIVIDGAGVGSAMTANKVPGVRAAACYSVKVAVNSREHNDANVLTLGSATVTPAEMREIVAAWLSTEITEDRHRKRVAKIVAVERQYRA
ncbi:MAG TPA: RpiB/LacA/LacB family sugar-phosphate isomerase [Pyrinomonadaceae bacterium]|nr:RpiB/LacA/LacB family sugar-phosphate isomerase [Pyrinomonadaceae bacterium]